MENWYHVQTVEKRFTSGFHPQTEFVGMNHLGRGQSIRMVVSNQTNQGPQDTNVQGGSPTIVAIA
jgi:hypothetical protein